MAFDFSAAGIALLEVADQVVNIQNAPNELVYVSAEDDCVVFEAIDDDGRVESLATGNQVLVVVHESHQVDVSLVVTFENMDRF